MHIDASMALAGLIVGFIIGLTGMGGGALMTPVLVIIFGISPAAAVSSDVVTSLVLKPFGGTVHARRGTVNWRLVRWLMLGSIPMAFLGAFLLDDLIGAGNGDRIKTILGWVLLVAAGAIVAKILLQRRRPALVAGQMMDQSLIRPIPTLLIGAVGGLIVGMTSVGSGSLIIVMLMLMYPTLSSREMVGTDLVQAIPLVGAAAIGHAIFGQPQLSVITSVLIGAIPAVILGAHFSSRASDRFIRPVLVAVLAVSALKLLNVSNRWLLAATIVGAVAVGVVFVRGRRARAGAPVISEVVRAA